VQLLLLAHGDAEARLKLAEPSAYVLDAESRVAKPLAVDSEQVPALAAVASTGEAFGDKGEWKRLLLQIQPAVLSFVPKFRLSSPFPTHLGRDVND
jgi:hypothetical protein